MTVALDVERLDEAIQFAIAFMNDPEGLADKREEWRDDLRGALHNLRAALGIEEPA